MFNGRSLSTYAATSGLRRTSGAVARQQGNGDPSRHDPRIAIWQIERPRRELRIMVASGHNVMLEIALHSEELWLVTVSQTTSVICKGLD